MKTGKKIAVALAAALAIAIFAGGAVSMVGADPDAEVTFTVDVRTFTVELGDVNTDFEAIVLGENKEMPAFTLTNPGIIPVLVEGKFSTGEGELFGFVSEGKPVLPALNFELNGVPFDITGEPVELADVLAESTTAYTATLTVPGGQPEAVYTGTIELIFSAAQA